jgi:alkanesulfonate monooxygenase SsuD/methylene tetrahydromethanopterin reductase-like flavin-dependent oxidoreductase (luciferase family)
MPEAQTGVILPTISPQPQGLPRDVAGLAREAEALGLESVWVVDQLVAGSGDALLESTVALATAAAATTRVRLGLGVLILPLRPVVWAAKQVATLQYLSGDRVLLGVGSGGGRHGRSWEAAGVPASERGRRTDAALRVLPGLLSGKPTRLDGEPGSPVVQLSPAATVPPILVGGNTEVAITRAVEHGDGWYPAPLPGTPPLTPAALADGAARLAELAAARGRRPPSITAGVMVLLSGDPTAPDRDSMLRALTAAPFEMPAEHAEAVLISGDAGEAAERLAGFAAAGAERLVVSFAGGDWRRQLELLAEANALLA